MEQQRWEYKVVFVEGWQRVSVEGSEMRPEQHERHSGFGRRFLNQMGTEGWELTGVQPTMPGRAYYVFKRPLAANAQPDMSVAGAQQPESQQPQQPQPTASGDVISV